MQSLKIPLKALARINDLLEMFLGKKNFASFPFLCIVLGNSDCVLES